jgi:S1-C subfamily serine protease
VAIAKKLAAATVTCRVTPPETRKGEPADVTVFSGISLGKGLIVTFSSAPESWRYRFTLPDGGQADAELRVIDNYSGLRVLEIAKRDLPGLAVAAETPAAGSTLYTAAAAGLEKPVLSRGILGGAERKFGGRTLPPLLQCDLRTTDTSTGSAVVDSEGRLVGIIAVHSASGHGDGWSYAIPVQHVVRAQRAYVRGEKVTLRTERPGLGIVTTLEGKEAVVVEKVTPNGPADKAGIKKGDQIVEVNGQKVRSPYQVQFLVLKQQPGDQMKFGVLQNGKSRTVDITLQGVGELRNDLDQESLQGRRSLDGKNYELGPGASEAFSDGFQAGGAAPGGGGGAAPGAGSGGAKIDRVPRDATGMRDAQIQRIYMALDLLQRENTTLKKDVKELSEQNDALKRELKEIKKQQEKAR